MNAFSPKLKLKLILAFYSVCFIGASLNHARDIWVNGLLPHSGHPVSLHVFWTSLTFVDLFVPLLFGLGRIKAGVSFALGIMLTDLAVNTWYSYNVRESIYWGNVDLIAQTAFLVFVMFTAPVIWAAENATSNPVNLTLSRDSEADGGRC